MLQIKNIFKTYKSSKGVTHRALQDVSITLPEKGLVFLLGASGSGKSTLLNILGGLDTKDSGDVLLNKHSITSLNESTLDSYRNTYLGFIFQEHNLIPSLNVFENVALALDLQNNKKYELVTETLNKVGIGGLAERGIYEISGGQRQRVAIARAIVKDPKIILADEPTGSLDSSSSNDVMRILKDFSKDRLVIVVTHDREFATTYADRLIELKDGVVLRDLVLNDGTSLSNKLEIVASSIVKIPVNYQIDEKDLTHINEVIGKTNKETFISIENDKNLVKAFYPHLRSAIDDSSLEKDGRFRQYQGEEEVYEEGTLKFKKSHLPFKRALKFGTTNLKNKRFRLVIMLLIAMISITLFAIGESFATYNQYSGMAYSLKKQNEGLASIVANYEKLPDLEFSDIREADIEKIKTIVGEDTPVYRTYSDSMKINNYKPKQALFETFKGFVEVNDVKSLGFTYYKYNADLAKRTDAVGITKFVANILKSDGFITNIDNLVNPTTPYMIKIDDKQYCISAIIDTKDDDLQPLLETKKDDTKLLYKHNVAASQYLYHLFVKEGFMIDSFKLLDNIEVNLVTSIKVNNHIQTISNIFSYESNYAFNNYSIHFFDDSKKDGYVIGLNAFLNVMQSELNIKPGSEFYDHDNFQAITDLVNQYNNSTTYITSKKSTSLYFASKDLPIIGIAYDCSPGMVNTKLDSIGLSQEEFNNISLLDKTSYGVLIKVDHAKSADIANKLQEEGYVLFSPYYSSYASFGYGIGSFGITIRLVSLGLALVVTLLLYGFISSSIKNSTHEIGILRALGARFTDIIKIFALETTVIGFVSFVLSYILTYVSAFVINAFYSKSTGFSFLVINMNLTTSLKMLILTIMVVTLSMLIPISRLSKMKPSDVIASRN
jgi:ABC-type lipoprotein export system ATPase subunit/ABC-type antimicrobial peptide transport system permease subunit